MIERQHFSRKIEESDSENFKFNASLSITEDIHNNLVQTRLLTASFLAAENIADKIPPIEGVYSNLLFLSADIEMALFAKMGHVEIKKKFQAEENEKTEIQKLFFQFREKIDELKDLLELRQEVTQNDINGVMLAAFKVYRALAEIRQKIGLGVIIDAQNFWQTSDAKLFLTTLAVKEANDYIEKHEGQVENGNPE